MGPWTFHTISFKVFYPLLWFWFDSSLQPDDSVCSFRLSLVPCTEFSNCGVVFFRVTCMTSKLDQFYKYVHDIKCCFFCLWLVVCSMADKWFHFFCSLSRWCQGSYREHLEGFQKLLVFLISNSPPHTHAHTQKGKLMKGELNWSCLFSFFILLQNVGLFKEGTWLPLNSKNLCLWCTVFKNRLFC